MPFLQIFWDSERLDGERIVEVRDRLLAEVGPVLMTADPDHVVNQAMIDVRLVAIGPLDRIRGDVFVTLFARDESARRIGSARVVEQLRAVVVSAMGGGDAVVELVLTNHYSSFDYASVE